MSSRVKMKGALSMPYCQNCGTEVNGNFCPNCGIQTGSVAPTAPEPVIHTGVKVEPRYSTGALVLAGYLGNGFLMTSLIAFILFTVHFLGGSSNFGEWLAAMVGSVCILAIAFLCYLPGILSVRKRSPEGMEMRTFWSFFRKAILFPACWTFTLAGCFYIIGLFFRIWRLGLWASKPNDNEYTAFVDGKKIPVVRYYDDLSDYGASGKYIYRDANGEFYRPPVK